MPERRSEDGSSENKLSGVVGTTATTVPFFGPIGLPA